jgi:hypothetical protein
VSSNTAAFAAAIQHSMTAKPTTKTPSLASEAWQTKNCSHYHILQEQGQRTYKQQQRRFRHNSGNRQHLTFATRTTTRKQD